MPQEIADGRERHPAHDEPGGEGMPQVVEMEVRHPCPLTGPLKRVPDVGIAPSFRTVKDPRHVLTGSKPTEETPEGFVEREHPCLPILVLLQADKAMRHIDTVPGKAQQFPFSHAGMNGCEDDGSEPVFTGLEQ